MTMRVRFMEELDKLHKKLVDNAIKYNTQNGYVKIFCNKLKGILEIYIEDSEIGIDESKLDRVFERFYRVDKSRSREEGSTGLNLAISKHIAKMLKGDIKIKNEIDVGSTLTLSIPQ